MRGHRPSATANGIYFAPVVCLQHTRYRVYVSAKRERQRKRGEPLRAWGFIDKTTMFTAACLACRRSASFSWTFPPLIFRAGCLPPTYALPLVCFGKARTPKELRTACPPLAFLYSRQRCSRRRAQACRRSASFSWTFTVAPLAAAPRLLNGRSVGKAILRFHSEPYARCAV